jgi:putative acyl-CoA dehydrogenase
MPRLYREAPLNAIWEGSGNVICLDVLRTLQKEPAALESLHAEFNASSRLDSRLDTWVRRTREMLEDPRGLEVRARQLVGRLALALQAGLLLRHAPPPIAEAFCASRLGGEWGHAFGTLPPEVEVDAILNRAAGGE